ncbi:MAG TPA: hypothetical protein DDY18_04570 [Flavobacterium sp.]|jgi:hypothetical protein|nr:hypothetical protein [Flavobacterium sp.]
MAKERPFNTVGIIDQYGEDLTVGDLKEALKNVPDDYQVSFDSFSIVPAKEQLSIDHDSRMICIND